MIRVAHASLFLAVASLALAADSGFVVKQVGDMELRLPLVAGMIEACNKYPELAQRAGSLTPASHEFITCMASEAVMAGIHKGVRREAYPLVAITVVRQHQSGPLTLREFEEIRARSEEYLRAQTATLESMQKDLDRQDQAIAANGGTLKRTNEGMEVGAFYKFTKQQPSFSYAITRRTTLSEAGATERICEVNFGSMLFMRGRMLAVAVIDHCGGSPADARAKAITQSWLTAFEALNNRIAR